MKMSIAKYNAECTDYHRPASLHKSSLRHTSSRQDTHNQKSHPDTGNTHGDPSVSHW
jgi:hypothetical protein